MRIAVLMPAYNEEGRLARTLDELRSVLGVDAPTTDASRAADVGAHRAHRAHGSRAVDVRVFLVDDGSAPPISEKSVQSALVGPSVVLARHSVNLGQGAALETARRLALDPRFAPSSGPFDVFVTMDSDGQHRADDVLAVARAVVAGADVALGNRFAGGSNVPPSRRVLLGLARIFERVTTGLALSDAHNGLRAFSPRAIERMRLRQNRMAHATEITRRISTASSRGATDDRLRLVEVPVSVRYSSESLAKGQRSSGAVTIVVDLFQSFLFGRGS